MKACVCVAGGWGGGGGGGGTVGLDVRIFHECEYVHPTREIETRDKYVYIHIYIYAERERERVSVCLCVCRMVCLESSCSLVWLVQAIMSSDIGNNCVAWQAKSARLSSFR